VLDLEIDEMGTRWVGQWYVQEAVSERYLAKRTVSLAMTITTAGEDVGWRVDVAMRLVW